MEIIKKIMTGLGVILVIAALIFIVVSNVRTNKKNTASIPKNVGEEDGVEEVVSSAKKNEDIIEYATEGDADDASATDGVEYASDSTEEENPHIKSSGKESLFKRDLGTGTASGTKTQTKKTKSSTTLDVSSDGNNSNASSSSNTGVDTSDDIDVSEDIEKPQFLTFTKNPKINVGNAFDIHCFMGYGDNLDRNVEMAISGNINVNETGSYPITVTLKDDAGNSISSDMTVSVVNSGGYTPDSDDDTPASRPGTDSFDEFKTKYAGANRTFGLDVSRWQGSIDFQKVKAAGCDFVIMRIGGLDDGELYTDRCYQTYLKDAKAAGLKIGVYWHAEEKNPQEVKDSVAYMKSILNGEKLDFPIAYDWEDWANYENYGMNFKDINKNYKTFYEEVQSIGYEACLYSSLNFLENVWSNEMHSKVWLAHYTRQTDYTGSYYMWQQTSSGKIDGVSSCVDFNVCYE